MLQRVATVSIISVFMLISSHGVSSEKLLVTVQSQDEKSMSSLTEALNRDIVLGADGVNRHPLGAIEMTMSRVVDVDDPINIAHKQSTPMLHLVEQLNFEETMDGNPKFTLKYETMQTPPGGEYPGYNRMLYLSKADTTNVVAGDVNNHCLREGSKSQCLSFMQYNYITPLDATFDQDYLTNFDPSYDIIVDVEDIPYSQRQKITVTIPFSSIIDHFGQESVFNHPTRGPQYQYKFAVGLLYTPTGDAGSNIIMYDVFHFHKDTSQLVSVYKETSYSIAQYVSFMTSEIEGTDIRIATVEFTLEGQHTLNEEETRIQMNGFDIADQCEVMKHKIAAHLNESSCLTHRELCKASTLSSSEALFATYVIPVFATPESGEVKIDILLRTNFVSADEVSSQVVSTLNFATRQPAIKVCSDAMVQDFDPVQYTEALLYRGSDVIFDTTFDRNLVLHNDSNSALSMPEALLTLVLSPKLDDRSLNYFDSFSSEDIALDAVYMSHSIDGANHESIFQATDNTIYADSTGHALIDLDVYLAQACPLLSLDTPTDATCVTTQDWQVSGRKLRPQNSMYFVYYVDFSDRAGTVEWLSEIVVSSEVAEAVFDKTLQRYNDRGDRARQHSKVYYLWPVYYWPGQSPLGLRDTTAISLAWSVTHNTNPAQESLGSRRLLGMRKIVKPFSTRSLQKARAKHRIQKLADTNKNHIKPVRFNNTQLQQLY